MAQERKGGPTDPLQHFESTIEALFFSNYSQGRAYKSY